MASESQDRIRQRDRPTWFQDEKFPSLLTYGENKLKIPNMKVLQLDCNRIADCYIEIEIEIVTWRLNYITDESLQFKLKLFRIFSIEAICTKTDVTNRFNTNSNLFWTNLSRWPGTRSGWGQGELF